jgi:hypothetical protein
MKIDEAARQLVEKEPRFWALDADRRRRLMEFVVGNTLFTLGHAAVNVFQLPVLGREEDAADTFATLALLHVGTDYAHEVLVDAARGLLRTAERDARLGLPPRFYQEHGLDQQRAYQIVCLMFGSDPDRFSQLAERAGLPPERRETCVLELSQAQDSWVRLLKPHFRSASPGKQSFLERLLRMPLGLERRSRIDIEYGDAPPQLAAFRGALMKVGILEAVRDFAAENFKFPEPITIEAKSCQEPNAYWDPAERRLTLCYELIADYAELAYRLGP